MGTNGMETGGGWVWACVLLAGAVFGVVYNWFMGWMERQGYKEGATAMLVVLGVMITLSLAVPLVGLEAVLKIAAVFMASGLPMIGGSWARFVVARRADEVAARREAEEIITNGTNDSNG